MKVVWSPLVRDQVVQAFGAIAAERPAAARRWFEEVLRKAGALESFPDMGRMVPEVGRSSIREVLVAPYRLIYRRDKHQVVILALRHCRRGLARDELD
ncbi:MAG: type II toxin-antitoxin system RelE/ParE family toxin [Armatimonadetes bacterium]|nr:type II toxin-antitoxin system RelE/ParE family toxin [Armatimonadota bacterium]